MKKVCKFLWSVVLFALAVFSILKLIELVKKYSLIQCLKGFGTLLSEDEHLVEISENGTKFLCKKDEDGLDAFKEYLDTMGYRYIGQFGSSNLYEFEGTEIVVKRTNLFQKYYLFEIFNERYFEETNEYAAI